MTRCARASSAWLQAQVHEGLRGVPGWLLVFDNADAAKDVERLWLRAFAQDCRHGLVDAARRLATLGHVSMELDVIDLPSAVTLLRTRATPG